MVGREWTELIAPERRDAATEALHAAMRGEAAEHESMLLDRLGNRIDVGLKLVPLRAHSEMLGAYAVFRNIEAQKNAERTIETQSDRVRRLYMVAAARGGSLDAQIDATLALGLELFGYDCAYVTQSSRIASSFAARPGAARSRRALRTRTGRRERSGVRTLPFRSRSSTKRTASWSLRDARRATRIWKSKIAI